MPISSCIAIMMHFINPELINYSLDELDSTLLDNFDDVNEVFYSFIYMYAYIGEGVTNLIADIANFGPSFILSTSRN